MTRFRLGVAWFVVVAFVVAGLLTVLCGSVRPGGVLMTLGLFAGAVMRALLPERYVLDIKVRSRGVDVVGYLVLGVAVLAVFNIVKLG